MARLLCLALLALSALPAAMLMPLAVSAIGAPTENFTVPNMPASDTANDEVKPNVNFLLEGPSTHLGDSAPAFAASLTTEPFREGNRVTAADKWFLDIDISAPGWLYIYEYYPDGSNPPGQWVAYKWHLKDSGAWKLGPFSATPGIIQGEHHYRIWFFSGKQWVQAGATGQSYSNVDWQYAKAPPPPRIVSFEANPTSIAAGEATLLTWDVQGADSIEISGIGPVTDNSGPLTARPLANSSYVLTARNGGGKTASPTVTVTVRQATAAETLGKLAGNPVIIIMALASLAVVILAVVLIRRYLAEKVEGEVTESSAAPALQKPALKTDSHAAAYFELPNGQQLPAGLGNGFTGRAELARALGLEELRSISRRHFRVYDDKGKYYIEDDSSSRGTLVNGKEIKGSGTASIEDGDSIEPAGTIRLTFHIR